MSKPWLDENYMKSLFAAESIKSDEDAVDWFEELGYQVSRRAITDARNKFGIAAKKNANTYEIELEPPRILFLDIETRPNLGYFWRLYDENIGINQLVDEHQLLCFAAKWYGSDNMEFYSEYVDGVEEMVRQARRLLDEADVVIHWNGKKFDIPHINKMIVLAGLTPPSSYKQVDLLHVVRKEFNFVSNKLQHVSTALGLEGKFEHEGFELWLKCMAGDPEAWKIMQTYNCQDVTLLDQIYVIVRPWIKSHPNVPLYRGVGSCPNCGSDNISNDRVAYTNVRTYPKFRCDDCGAQMRGKKYQTTTDFVPMTY
jgi:uncharacterized protein YprB with RNaseH-like and TPR domain